ncbi:hypothetical protein RJ641_033327 [Dillenia turbinata]|uniref:Uncharacterized protein n=1 Tax=Dillenia turbinata TaxID=194707 RepID=A0AAN8VZF5_9MAGN
MGPLGGASRGMGGGSGGTGGGGGGMLRTVGRTFRTSVGGVQEPFSSTNNTTTTTTCNTSTKKSKSAQRNSNKYLSLSSSSSSTSPRSSSSATSPNFLISTSNFAPFSSLPSTPTSFCGEELDWVAVDGFEDERACGYFDDFVFGSVPSVDEVQNAVSALQRAIDPATHSQLIRDRFSSNSDKDTSDHRTCGVGLMHTASSFGSDSDWIEPSLYQVSPGALQPRGTERVYDAFHLLQTEPSVQKMVISLSSDQAVWSAVLNNEVVQELRESLAAGSSENNGLWGTGENSGQPDAARNIFRWMFDGTKAKLLDLMKNITKLVNELFKSPNDGNTMEEGEAEPFDEKLRSTFLLSILVLLIVVVTRAQTA